MNNGSGEIDEVHETRVLIWKRLAIGALIVIGLVLSFTSVYNSFVNKTTLSEVRQTTKAVRDTQTNGSPTILRLTQLAEQIRSCTDPDGECYKQAQEQTAKAIVGINEGTLRVVAAALSCQADGITEQKQLARCTIERSTP